MEWEQGILDSHGQSIFGILQAHIFVSENNGCHDQCDLTPSTSRYCCPCCVTQSVRLWDITILGHWDKSWQEISIDNQDPETIESNQIKIDQRAGEANHVLGPRHISSLRPGTGTPKTVVPLKSYARQAVVDGLRRPVSCAKVCRIRRRACLQRRVGLYVTVCEYAVGLMIISTADSQLSSLWFIRKPEVGDTLELNCVFDSTGLGWTWADMIVWPNPCAYWHPRCHLFFPSFLAAVVGCHDHRCIHRICRPGHLWWRCSSYVLPR